jgi:hypothetical protein
MIGVALMAGVVWTGWAFWAVLLCALGAWESLPVPGKPPLTLRAKAIAGITVVAFWLSFMPSPIEIEGFELADLNWITADGEPISAEIHQQLKAALVERLDPGHPQR